jgi:PEGA domain-containing protein
MVTILPRLHSHTPYRDYAVYPSCATSQTKSFRITCLGVFLVVGLCVCLPGCVRRRMTIRSNPPGAFVYVDNYPIGTTPVSTNFTHYGTRSVRLVKDGFETQTVQERIAAPWYQIPPLDFISENLVPGEIRDHRTLSYQMQPQMVVPSDVLLDRAEDLRGRAGTTGMFRTSPLYAGGSFTPPPTRSGSTSAPTPAPNLGQPTLPPVDPRTPSVMPPSGPILPPAQPGNQPPPFHTLPPGGQPLR